MDGQGEVMEVVVVEVAHHRVGVPTRAVEEVLPVAWITRLPGAPPPVVGVLDVRGELVAVVDGRRRLAAPSRPVRLSDRLVVLRTDRHRLALHVDAVLDIVRAPTLDLPSTSAVPDALAGAGIARVDDGLLVVHDPDAFLSAQESDALDAALAELVPDPR